MNTSQRVREYLVERFGLTRGEIAPARSLASLGVDSLAAMEMRFDLEEEFGVRISDARADVVTLADLVAEIDRQLAQRRVHTASAGGVPRDRAPTSETR